MSSGALSVHKCESDRVGDGVEDKGSSVDKGIEDVGGSDISSVLGTTSAHMRIPLRS